jgi:DNA-binding NarL/FixJ family response regulator
MDISIDHLQQIVTFSPAEVRVIEYLISGGPTNQQIAISISRDCSRCNHRTVQAHISNILSKTEFANRTALALWAVGQPGFKAR